jgi:nitrite transporter NirC
MDGAVMERQPLSEVEKLALKKVKIFRQSLLRYILRSMLASMFIGFGVIVAFKTGNYFYLEHSPWAYPIAALTFGSEICLLVIHSITLMLHCGGKWLG